MARVDDFFTEGCHLVKVEGNMTTKIQRIDPDFATVHAALLYLYEPIVEMLREATEGKPTRELAETEQYAFEEYKRIVGDGVSYLRLTYPSIGDAAHKLIEMMRKHICKKTDEYVSRQSLNSRS